MGSSFLAHDATHLTETLPTARAAVLAMQAIVVDVVWVLSEAAGTRTLVDRRVTSGRGKECFFMKKKY